MTTQIEGDAPSVLVVEDELLIAMDISDTVTDLGLRVEGPFVSRKTALAAISSAMPDVAILDVFAADGEVFPLADILDAAGVPIIFHSGHVSSDDVNLRYPDAQTVSKPCPHDRMIAVLEFALAQSKARLN